ncbi:MAG: MFS transporter [Gammaproteobacteria bacterium]
MSTIVAVTKGGRGWIAADTLTTFGDTRQSSAYEKSHDKIFRHGDSYIGVVGSAAHQIVLQSVLAEHEDFRFDGRAQIFESFRRLHPLLKEQYFLNPKDDDEDPYESTRIDALIVNPAGVFAVFALREAFEYTRFWAVGSGSEIALGAMYAAYDNCDSGRDIARIAIEASAEFNVATALPLSIYSVELDV